MSKRGQCLALNLLYSYTIAFSQVRLLSGLDHPNIIKYLNSFISDNDLIIIVEWAAAGDLKRQLRKAVERGSTFEERLIWKYFSQIAEAIRYMHEHRIMHRDLKPANIFLTLGGVVKVGDLGLSRELSENTLQAHSKVGTPLYMSPEVLRGDGYGFTSDIWSIGCLLYELANLKSPFKSEGLNLYSLFQKISKGEYELLNDRYSENLRSLAYSMITIEPQDRPDIVSICKQASEMRLFTSQGEKSGISMKRAIIREESGGEDLREGVLNDAMNTTNQRPVSRGRGGESGEGRNTKAGVNGSTFTSTLQRSRSDVHSEQPLPSSSVAIKKVGLTSTVPAGSNDGNEDHKTKEAGDYLITSGNLESNSSPTGFAQATLLHSKLEALLCPIPRPCRHLHFSTTLTSIRIANASSHRNGGVPVKLMCNQFSLFVDVSLWLLNLLEDSGDQDKHHNMMEDSPMVLSKAILFRAQVWEYSA